MSQAFSAAKRVRTETEVGRLAVSVSYAAVELARKIFEGLEGKAVLLVGAGKMSELAARHLSSRARCRSTWPTAPGAAPRSWRGRWAARAVPFEELDDDAGPRGHRDHLDRRRPSPSSPRRRCGPRCTARRGRPLFFIDIAVPRNVEPAVNDLDDAFCYDIDDLRAVVESNLKRAAARGPARRGPARARGRQVRGTPAAARGRAHHRVAAREAGSDPARRAGARAGPPARRRQRTRAGSMEALSQAIVNKVLHAPMVKLQGLLARRATAARWTEMVSRAVRAARTGPAGR